VKGKIDIDLMAGLSLDPRYEYVTISEYRSKWSNFMFKMGRIEQNPESWNDLFW
jgi:hypothetical protein